MKKRITIEYTDEEMKKNFRLKCVQENISMTQKIISWIKKFLKKEIL